jgi:hypothetical protein
MRLHELAHARSGDKGHISDITVIAYDIRDYDHLARHVTAEAVNAHFSDIVRGRVDRFEVPQLGALKFVMYGALDGGVTRTLNLDPHGKALGSCLLELDIPEPLRPDSPTHPTTSARKAHQ